MSTISEKIYDSRDEQPARGPRALRELPGSQQILDTINTVHVKYEVDDITGERRARAMTFRRAEYLTGVTRHSGQRYFRWRSTREVIRLTASGRMFSTTIAPGQSPNPHAVERAEYLRNMGYGLGPRHPATPLIIEHLGEPKSFEAAYPLGPHFGWTQSSNVRDKQFLACFEDVEDAATLSQALFGKRAMRKSLTKAVAKADPRALYIAWCLRGRHVPIDWIIDFLRQNEAAVTAHRLDRHVNLKGLRPYVRGLDRTSVRRLLRNGWTGADHALMTDITRMKTAPDMAVTSARSWTDLHDQLAMVDNLVRAQELQARDRAVERRIAARRAREDDPEHQARAQAAQGALQARRDADLIAQDKANERRIKAYEALVAALPPRTEAGLSITVAKDARTLLAWGREMRNCIAAYEYERAGRKAVLLGLAQGDRLVANVEIRLEVDGSAQLQQLLGKHNQSLPAAQIEDVLHVLVQAGVDTNQRWTGMPALARLQQDLVLAAQ